LQYDLSADKRAVVAAAIDQGISRDADTFSLIDRDGLQSAVAELNAAFPAHFSHSFATKANTYRWLLKVLCDCGMMAEAASDAELSMAIAAGFSAARTVYDAPIKKRLELERILLLGVHVNVDNFQELEAIAQLLQINPSSSSIGLRVNPQIGAGSVAISSTSTLTSKFGFGLKDVGVRKKLIEAYLGKRWLNAIHVHVGSVGCPLSLLCEGVKATVELANEINSAAGHDQITTVNIGGGLPVNFDSDTTTPTFADYADQLLKYVPDLASGRYKAITEFGRSICAKHALTLARVEYTKTNGGRSIALTHVGVHNLMRVVFQPEEWARRVSALDKHGKLKMGSPTIQDIAGPCCIAGDVVARGRSLPLLEPGDYVLVHDTGAYCFNNPYLLNSLPSGPIYGFSKSPSGEYEFETVSKGQTVQDVVEQYS
jgi:diaminopimelate decarboxylase